MSHVDPADHGLAIVPPEDRIEGVERVVSIRKRVWRCAAYTAAGRQCASSGTLTDVPGWAAERPGTSKVPLCGQHRAMIGMA